MGELIAAKHGYFRAKHAGVFKWRCWCGKVHERAGATPLSAIADFRPVPLTAEETRTQQEARAAKEVEAVQERAAVSKRLKDRIVGIGPQEKRPAEKPRSRRSRRQRWLALNPSPRVIP